jgi:hypothetical protein
MHDSDPDIWQYLPTLHERDAVWSSSLKHHHTVHPQGTLVNINTGGLRVLGALGGGGEEREGQEGGRVNFRGS